MVTIQCGAVTFEQIQAVIFDKDGTLADVQDYLRNLGQKRARLIDAQIPGVQDPLLMAFGFESDRLNPYGLLAVGTRQENEIAAAAYVAETGRDWIAALSLVRSAFDEADKVLKRKADSTPLFEGVIPTLQTLSQAGVAIGILSSDTLANVQDFIDRYELGAFIQLSQGAVDGLSKPDPAVLLQASQSLGISATSILVVGDSAADIEMAKAAKAAGSVGVTWNRRHVGTLAMADVLISQLTDIQVQP
ncbi:HAD family hydrolase [Pantanalinema sp. GBBB05]|uniref:HAD family hydrolase n=1 Tax=Pantanalinema sp. GBBB05 TaxID=2604139 RepID=UPI001D83C99D|nr:HAD family hydrolase [Pantanalinema sp. GBBB05]